MGMKRNLFYFEMVFILFSVRTWKSETWNERQKSGDRSQETEVRRQKIEDRKFRIQVKFSIFQNIENIIWKCEKYFVNRKNIY